MKADPKDMETFAGLLIKLKDEYKAANRLYPNNPNLALWVAVNWPKDETFNEIYNSKLLKGNELDNLPNKADLARKIWDKLDSGFLIPEEFTKMAKLYAEVMSFIEKAPTAAVNLNQVNNKVMIVNQQASDDDWANKLKNNQTKLIEDARSN